MEPTQLEHLIGFIRTDRFLPIPPANRIFTGADGNQDSFRLEGCNALRSLVQHGLKPEHSVLDIGSGIGRVALPLTFYLTTGKYVGIDIVLDGVSWCRENISTKYPNFTFLHSDIRNDYYNPTGMGEVSDLALPYEDASFDFIFLNSVFTHLFRKDMEAYLHLIAKLLKKGGCLWCSWFLLDEATKMAVGEGKGIFRFVVDEGPDYHLPNQTTVAVGYDERYALAEIEARGLKVRQVFHGNWSGIHATQAFQDLVVAEKPFSGASEL